MSLRLKGYIAAIAAVALALLIVYAPGDLATRWPHYLGWVVICVVSEGLWVSTFSGTGTVTMASTAGLAAAMLWGRGASMMIVVASTAIAELFVLRKPPIRVFFNSSQIAITMWFAASAFEMLGGLPHGLFGAASVGTGDGAALRLALPTVGMLTAYLLANRALVAVAVSWSTERAYLKVLREDWFTVERLLQDLSAFLLSPLMVVSFVSIGYSGVLLFFAPLWLLNESAKRYLELQRAQNQVIHSERMAAKGEMAAEVGHELRNQLAAISGRAQMLLRDADKQNYANLNRHAQIILDQSQRMERLSKGLMEFSGAEPKMERVDVNALLQRTIEFVRTQNRFDGVEWDVQLCEPPPELRADPGQLQQVLLNLFMNAADAMNAATNGGSPPRKLITVITERDDRAGTLRCIVRDTGPGIPASNLVKIFEPHFTTKADGHGFGLSTSYRIVGSHGGRIGIESPLGQGATLTVSLPLGGPGSWN